jgi:hypothetical protein
MDPRQLKLPKESEEAERSLTITPAADARILLFAFA